MDGYGDDHGWWRREDGESFESLSYLLRSEHRVAVLEAVQHSTLNRTELQATTGVTRPTLSRILSSFESRRWITREASGKYTATTIGAMLVEEVLGAMATFRTCGRLESVIETVPRDLLPSDPSNFADAVVTVSKPGAPAGPTRRLASLVEASRTYQECYPMVLGQPSRAILTSHLASEGTATVVVQPAVVEGLAADPVQSVLDALEADRLDVAVTESVPFRLTILDDRVAIARHDEATGAVTALMDMDRRRAIDWAEGVFESLLDEATPLEETGIDLAARNPAQRVLQVDGKR